MMESQPNTYKTKMNRWEKGFVSFLDEEVISAGVIQSIADGRWEVRTALHSRCGSGASG